MKIKSLQDVKKNKSKGKTKSKEAENKEAENKERQLHK